MRHPTPMSATMKVWTGTAALLLVFTIWTFRGGPELGRTAASPMAASPVTTGSPIVVASPMASPVPTAVLGQPVLYADDWIITATDAWLTPSTPFATPKGTFVVVALTIENRGSLSRGFPFDDLRLAVAGIAYAPDFGASNTIGGGYFQQFLPTEPQDNAVVFDVPGDALGNIVLESAGDPMLRILVRQNAPPVASPQASPAPPAAMGQPVPYSDRWLITATDVSLKQQTVSLTPQGIFAVVAITIENAGTTPRHFPFGDLRLEAADQRYAPELDATNTLGRGRYQLFAPSEPQETAVVFDIPASASGPYMLLSASDPNLRILVDLPRRG